MTLKRESVLRTTGVVYAPTPASLAKEVDLKRHLYIRLGRSSGPYELTEAMLAKELGLRRRPMPSLPEPDVEYDLAPYQPSRAMLAKEADRGRQLGRSVDR